MRKTINTFRIYNDDPADIKTLLLKLHLESPIMDEWIIGENDYTFGGQYKGFLFRNLIASDKRFELYRDRITVIEGSFDNKFRETKDIQECRGRAWASENFLKDLPVPYILNKYKDNDVWVAAVDFDEMLDGRDDKRFDKIFSELTNETVAPKFLTMVRYWYDYDNWSRGRGYTILPIELVRSTNSISRAYDDYLHEATPNPDPRNVVAFEYCQCCSLDQIMNKFRDGPFYYFVREDFEEAFRCNYWPKSRFAGEHPVPPWEAPDNWFNTIELNEENSPTYVVEHLAELKTHNIDPNYRENRKIRFPEWFK